MRCLVQAVQSNTKVDEEKYYKLCYLKILFKFLISFAIGTH